MTLLSDSEKQDAVICGHSDVAVVATDEVGVPHSEEVLVGERHCSRTFLFVLLYSLDVEASYFACAGDFVEEVDNDIFTVID